MPFETILKKNFKNFFLTPSLNLHPLALNLGEQWYIYHLIKFILVIYFEFFVKIN